MAEQPLSESEATLRDEIRAAIAAGREVDPSLDEHLADSVLARYRESTRALRATQPAQVVRHSSGLDSLARALITIAVLGFILGLITLDNGDHWWLIFFLWPLFGWIGWGRWGHDYSHHTDGPTDTMRDAHDRAKAAKYEARAAYYRQRAAQYHSGQDTSMV